MINFIPYQAEHLSQVKLQEQQKVWSKEFLKPGYAEALALPNMAWSAVNDNDIVGCAGFIPHWDGRVAVWSIFGQVPKRAWLSIVRKIEYEFQNTLADHGPHRIEATTPVGFNAGCRLAKILNFEVEGLMKQYGPDGRDHFMLARIV